MICVIPEPAVTVLLPSVAEMLPSALMDAVTLAVSCDRLNSLPESVIVSEALPSLRTTLLISLTPCVPVAVPVARFTVTLDP